MKRKVLVAELVSAAVVIVLGFVFHFAFEWLNGWKPAALIFAVNESVWEHCKIGFWPALIISVVEFFWVGRLTQNFLAAKAALLLIIPASIIVLFYTYTGIIGYNIFLVDISIFFIAVLFGQCASYRLLTAEPLPAWIGFASAGTILILIILFSTLTYRPLSIPLFMDPNTGGYGIPPEMS